MTNDNRYVRVEADNLGIMLVSNDAGSVSSAVTLLRADKKNVERVEKQAQSVQIYHPVDRTDPVVTGNMHRFRVDLKPATSIPTYAQALVKKLEEQLSCKIEFRSNTA
jgi:hypothetical protein